MTQIAQLALDAVDRNLTNECYPTGAPPSKPMLKQWSTVLQQSFIRTGLTLVNITLFQPESIASNEFPHLTLVSFLRHRPKELAVMAPSVLLVSEETSALLATCLCMGNSLCAFCDGTVKDGIGSHGWQIRPSLALTTDIRKVESAALLHPLIIIAHTILLW